MVGTQIEDHNIAIACCDARVHPLLVRFQRNLEFLPQSRGEKWMDRSVVRIKPNLDHARAAFSCLCSLVQFEMPWRRTLMFVIGSGCANACFALGWCNLGNPCKLVTSNALAQTS